MTISSTANRVAYNGNGGVTAFGFPYAFQEQEDLKVLETVIATGVQTAKTLTTDYTISGATDGQGFYPGGGTVTMLVAPASGVRLTIYRDPVATQETDLVENDPLPAETLESAYDKAVMLIQRLRDIVTRSLRQPDGDSSDIGILPAKVVRAGKLLRFNATTGDPEVVAAADIDLAAVSPFVEGLLDDPDAATFRTSIGAGATGDAIFTAATAADARDAIGLAAGLVTIESTDDGVAAGPTLNLYRDSATPAANDVMGVVVFDGEDSGGDRQTYAEVDAEIVDPTATSEDGRLRLRTAVAGTVATRFFLGNGIYGTTVTGGDKGAETFNSKGLYRDGNITGRTLLASELASNTSALQFTEFDSTLYASYEFELEELHPATDNVEMLVQVSINGGSSYRSTAGDYDFALTGASSTPTAISNGSASATSISLCGAPGINQAVGNSTNEKIQGTLKLIRPDFGNGVMMNFETVWRNNGSVLIFGRGAGALKGANNPVNGIQFLFSSGNISQGVIRMYGIPR